MRLFIAIELPDDAKKELGRLRMDIPGPAGFRPIRST